MSSPSAIFLSKTEAQFLFATAGEEAKGQEPRNLSGVEDLNGGDQGTA